MFRRGALREGWMRVVEMKCAGGVGLGKIR
jgi:hypothetical protein